MFGQILTWYRSGGSVQPLSSSREVVFLRAIGSLVLAVFAANAIAASPHPSLHSTGLVVLLATAAFVLSVGTGIVLASMPPRFGEPALFALVMAITAATAAGAVAQPNNGSWSAGPYFIAVIAAVRLGRVSGAVTLALADGSLLAVAATRNVLPAAASLLILGALPWFLIMRLLQHVRAQHQALEVSSVAEARAAVLAERGRIAREMHDILAHSLSALALHLESTRLLARDRHSDPEIVHALDKAHHLAASGLDEARRAIAAARGDEVPGPEGLGALIDGFREQAALPVSLEVWGEPRQLPAEARLALFRTAQEALTNVRRHAVPEQVKVRLDYREDATVLVVEDRATVASPPAGVLPGGHGFGLVGMRERAELLGGSLVAAPTSDGFRVELHLPSVDRV